ncbi:MAG: formimidoylglutamase [Chloracidobacterium sp.]|nr:formimidoylglutamase [Chloracidobacterium sp.]
MENIFELTDRPAEELFQAKRDPNDPRLSEVVGRAESDLDAADIVILGCPEEQGIVRAGGRAGAAMAPKVVREQFYRLTPLNISRRIFDLGDVRTGRTLEETHERFEKLIEALLSTGKRVVVIGGGNDAAYPCGAAMSAIYGTKNWIAINVDSHLDVRKTAERNSSTAFRQLLEEDLLIPSYFYEVGYQSHFCSPVYFEHIRSLGVNRISLELLRSRTEADIELKENIKLKFIGHSSSLNTFFSFDMHAVRSADAPGTNDPSPLGLRAGEFIQLVKYAASLANTRIAVFSEVNPSLDLNGRTSALVAIAMHRFCSGIN